MEYTGCCKYDFNMHGYTSGDPSIVWSGASPPPCSTIYAIGEGGATILAAGIDRGAIRVISYGMIRYVRRGPAVPVIN